MLFVVGCSTNSKLKDHVKTDDIKWKFLTSRTTSGEIIYNKHGKKVKNACLSREEFKKWKEYQVRQCKGF